MAKTIQLADSSGAVYPTGTVILRDAESDTVTINANSTQWITLNQPSVTGYTPCGAIRWYLSGTNATGCNVYAVDNNSIAVRNMGSSTASVKITAKILYYASYS